ncbi:hypothetical protein [Ahrensia sp. R2A130]|uniref:hypothetical protein n=1 Tax=Ahrensia sp. R2A130 TaxID=744979 RepID=UPI0001E0BCD0|nr:hypothetical protein [Ahrensia sp. R2A130]EFL88344.1 conserved hypothetical protein [Ahrensia sp. R2A130]
MSAKMDECNQANVDPVVVARLAKRAERLGKDIQAAGLTAFGGSGSLTLRAVDPDHSHQLLIVANVYGPTVWDGGDGAHHTGCNGLEYGE